MRTSLLVTVVLATLVGVAMICFGEPLYRAMGGSGASLAAALAYSDLVFGGALLVWLFNTFAAILRGSGNMMVPAVVITVGALLLIPISPLLIFGIGPFPLRDHRGCDRDPRLLCDRRRRDGRLDLE